MGDWLSGHCMQLLGLLFAGVLIGCMCNTGSWLPIPRALAVGRGVIGCACVCR